MEATIEPEEAPEYCLRHHSVETVLRCGSCGDLICPRCLIQTPVGARCPNCGRSRPAPMYALAPQHYVAAYGTAIVLGIGLGVAWWFVKLQALGLFFAVLAGAGMGWIMFSALDKLAGGRRGPVIQVAAGIGLVLAYLVRNVLATDALLISGDIGGLTVVVVAILVATSQLR